jgi:hypothetical protein
MDPEDIEHFKTHGYVVIPFFSADEVQEMRTLFHGELPHNHENVLYGLEPPQVEGVRGKSAVGSMYYNTWKLEAQLKLYDLAKSLMNATFSSAHTLGYEHPLGRSEDVLPFIDHVCYRLPDHIRAEGGLGLHIDRNPHTPYNMSYFRPIQSSVALTDHYGSESGGILLVPGFHKEYDTFFKEYIKKQEPRDGSFFRMENRSYRAVKDRLVPLTVPAGHVVFWDNRLPHATCEKLVSADTREVFFFSYLPDIKLNRDYYKRQMECMACGKAPPCFAAAAAAAHAVNVNVPESLLARFNKFSS